MFGKKENLLIPQATQAGLAGWEVRRTSRFQWHLDICNRCHLLPVLSMSNKSDKESFHMEVHKRFTISARSTGQPFGGCLSKTMCQWNLNRESIRSPARSQHNLDCQVCFTQFNQLSMTTAAVPTRIRWPNISSSPAGEVGDGIWAGTGTSTGEDLGVGSYKPAWFEVSQKVCSPTLAWTMLYIWQPKQQFDHWKSDLEAWACLGDLLSTASDLTASLSELSSGAGLERQRGTRTTGSEGCLLAWTAGNSKKANHDSLQNW